MFVVVAVIHKKYTLETYHNNLLIFFPLVFGSFATRTCTPLSIGISVVHRATFRTHTRILVTNKFEIYLTFPFLCTLHNIIITLHFTYFIPKTLVWALFISAVYWYFKTKSRVLVGFIIIIFYYFVFVC